MTNSLVIENLTAGYDEITNVIFDVSLSVKRNEIVGLIGPNGCGKSTILRCIAGLIPSQKGRIVHEGKELPCGHPDSIRSLGIVYTPQSDAVFDGMNVVENLKTAGYLINEEQELSERVKRVFEVLLRLRQLVGQKAGNLSGGEKKLLAFAMALVPISSVLALDEPSASLAPEVSDDIGNILRSLSTEGKAVIFAEQNLNFVKKFADRFYVIRYGRVVEEGSPKEVRRILEKDTREFIDR